MKSKPKKLTKNKSSQKKKQVRYCPDCESKFLKVVEPFKSDRINPNTGKKIVIKDAIYYKCSNKECGYSWVPSEEINRVENAVDALAWEKLKPEEISMIREAMGFGTKSRASKFLGLNEKAFVKMEQGTYSDLNNSTDLLLRLAVFNKQNFNFIRDLHKNSFKFIASNYEMLCSDPAKWSYNHITKKDVKVEGDRVFIGYRLKAQGNVPAQHLSGDEKINKHFMQSTEDKNSNIYVYPLSKLEH